MAPTPTLTPTLPLPLPLPLAPTPTPEQGREALFESLSNEAELCFTTLKAPTPSVKKGPAAATAVSTNAPAGGALPPEFLRAGGCFAPECTLERLVPGEGDAARVEVAHTR